MRNQSKQHRRARRVAAWAAVASAAAATPVAFADVSANTSGAAQQNGIGNPAVTLSLSGSTAMRTFTTSQNISFLNPGDSITLNNGSSGAAVLYTAPAVANETFQLANGNFTAADTGAPFPSGATNQVHSALRLEWHEQGSVEGILELANDQIGFFGGSNGTPLIDSGTRNATKGNPIWVNRNTYTSSASVNGLPIANSAYNTYVSYDATGKNLQGGMNRVQLAISDVKAVQGFATGGTSATGNLTLTPGALGYGKGNNNLGLAAANSLPTNSAAIAGSFYQLHDATVLNMETTKLDPKTGANYTAGAWNTAGTDNLQSTTVAITATTFSANPGTGLDKLNRTDAQWLQTTGHLTNGAGFNFTTRDVGSGTRNVAALNTGVDPTFAVGVNDAGNGNDLTAGDTAQDQLNIGGAMKFSNKTAGGGQLRPTLQNNRMALGTLSISDAISAVSNGGGSKPLRALSYSDSTDGSTGYVTVGASTIIDGSYAIWQQEQYVTVKAPNAAFSGVNGTSWASLTDAQTGIKGDNTGSNVAAFRKNILVSTSAFPNTNSVGNAADGLLNSGFILPQMMAVTKPNDGVGLAVSAGTNQRADLAALLIGSSYANAFNADNPTAITRGSGSTYGNAGNNTASFQGQIKITDANYLFGNFNQLGTRDLASLQSATTAQAALGAGGGAGVSIFSGSSNATVVHTGIGALDNATFLNQANGTSVTKGDLIAMGDFNGDGKFDGKDLYLFATNAALADSTNTTALTPTGGETLGDAIRRGVLRKNAALDYLQTNGTAQQKTDAAVTASANPLFNAGLAQANAFSKFDVNHDGVVDLIDASIVDKFVGKSLTNLTAQLSAVITGNATNAADIISPGAKPQTPFNLYSAQLIDGQNMITNATSSAGLSDFNLIRQHLGAALIGGDTSFKGKVDISDFNTLAINFNQFPGSQKWSKGDFNADGKVDIADFNILAINFNKSASAPSGQAIGNPPTVGTLARSASPSLTGTVADGGSATSSAAPANGLELDINPTTGDVTVTGNNATLLTSLDIKSASLALNSNNLLTPAQFSNLLAFGDDELAMGIKLAGPGSGPQTLNSTLDLGLIFRPGGLHDLTFSYGQNGNTVFVTPVYVGVPEPTTLSLLGLGAVGLLSRRRRKTHLAV